MLVLAGVNLGIKIELDYRSVECASTNLVPTARCDTIDLASSPLSPTRRNAATRTGYSAYFFSPASLSTFATLLLIVWAFFVDTSSMVRLSPIEARR